MITKMIPIMITIVIINVKMIIEIMKITIFMKKMMMIMMTILLLILLQTY